MLVYITKTFLSRYLCLHIWNIDLLGITHCKSILAQPRWPLVKTTPREVYLFWPNCCTENFPNHLIKLSIQDFAKEPDLKGNCEMSQMILIRGYTECQVATIPDMACAIVSETLPSLDELLSGCMNSYHSCNSGPFVGLHKTFGKFGEYYCREGTNLPLVRSSPFSGRAFPDS
jgi:hypothetical protein